MIESALFYFFAAILMFSAIQVVISKNPVQAALFLMLSFFGSSALWLLLEAEFLAIILILVYVGAVMVLFLFVIMMLDINIEELRAGFVQYLPVGIVVGLLVIAEVIAVILKANIHAEEIISIGNKSNIEILGNLVYSKYLFDFELAAAILLVALVAAVALVLKTTKKNNKKQNINKQLRTVAKDCVYVVDLPKGDQND